MTIRHKIFVVENYIIDKLTPYTWWVKVRFGKSNIDLAFSVQLKALLLLFVGASYGCIKNNQDENLYAAIAYSLAVSGTFLMCIGYIFRPALIRKIISENFPQGYPSPSRSFVKTSDTRLFGIFWGTLIGIIFVWTHVIFFGFLSISVFLFGLSYFLMSCDSLPPEENRDALQSRK